MKIKVQVQVWEKLNQSFGNVCVREVEIKNNLELTTKLNEMASEYTKEYKLMASTGSIVEKNHTKYEFRGTRKETK